MTTTAPDRRQRRRAETLREVLDVAVQVMAEQGVAGLTLGEVARRMGIRTPSLYVYLDSKNALYDALFERGWRELLVHMTGVWAARSGDAVRDLHGFATAFARWSVENKALAPLMFWRPIPGFEPSAAAYAPAVELFGLAPEMLQEAQDQGVVRTDVDQGRAIRSWTALIAGVVTQQLANAPEEPFDTGSFTVLLPELVDMWLTYHGPAAGRAPGPEEGTVS